MMLLYLIGILLLLMIVGVIINAIRFIREDDSSQGIGARIINLANDVLKPLFNRNLMWVHRLYGIRLLLFGSRNWADSKVLFSSVVNTYFEGRGGIRHLLLGAANPRTARTVYLWMTQNTPTKDGQLTIADLSPVSRIGLDRIQERHPEIPITFVRENFVELTIPNKSFELITTDNSLQCVSEKGDRQKMLRRLRDILTDDGILVSTITIFDGELWNNKETVEQYFKEAGFNSVEIIPIRTNIHERMSGWRMYMLIAAKSEEMQPTMNMLTERIIQTSESSSSSTTPTPQGFNWRAFLRKLKQL
jgi:ubiquinone/menaquinone biosynthesis C-methylase UbiE